MENLSMLRQGPTRGAIESKILANVENAKASYGMMCHEVESAWPYLDFSGLVPTSLHQVILECSSLPLILLSWKSI